MQYETFSISFTAFTLKCYARGLVSEPKLYLSYNSDTILSKLYSDVTYKSIYLITLAQTLIKINMKTLTAEAVKNGLPIPQITYFWM